MGCDIHIWVEKRDTMLPLPEVQELRIVGQKYPTPWKKVEPRFPSEWADGGFTDGPFDWRQYGMYTFLAGVRNYGQVIPISRPRGLPEDVSEGAREILDMWDGDGHSYSWLLLGELLDFNYNTPVENLRHRKQTGPNSWTGAAVAEPGQGVMTTYREELGEGFFRDLAILASIGPPDDVRIVFFFDN